MGGIRKKKFKAGEGAQYMSRTQALRKLQLSLKNFRHLCILKGIYPREPKKRKIAQRGATGFKTLYAVKDIQFLAAEPMIWEMRKYKPHFEKLRRAVSMRNMKEYRRQLEMRPEIKLDHIIKERFPSFIDAIRDLDDCLTLLFLFSTFPSLNAVPRDQSAMCRRLTMEFLHIVIASRALRKVFVSIKGYYFQAELKGETVTWIVPHQFSFNPDSAVEVDFKTMSFFVEFYCVLLGFVNYRLYHQLNLYYPPKLSQLSGDEIEKTLADEGAYYGERIASLNVELTHSSGNANEEEQELDQFTLSEDPDKMDQIQKEIEHRKKLKTLFEGVKIFVNREVPREPVVFCIRALGGTVSWDKRLFVGATFDEDDETITHQIVDRPSMEKQYISRYYVQPQWVFDSVNAGVLLPIERYLMGAILPPHLSPFLDGTRDNRYKPPEELALKGEAPVVDADKDEEKSDEEESEEEAEYIDSVNLDDYEEEEEEEEDENGQPLDEKEKERLKLKKRMAVTKGTMEKPDPLAKQREETAEYKMREKMIRNKHRKLYRHMMDNRQKWGKETARLEQKRKRVEAEQSASKKETRIQKKKAAAQLQA
ncbi:pescadillo homolog [Thrips palmi]|uniref:Pescadillo homolog n=1 Tax=Thrips palmi TaxID=161013 RepID=A0A6P8Y3Z1_THRPL|nr:pescadillo homolog [Thrips palmi]